MDAMQIYASQALSTKERLAYNIGQQGFAAKDAVQLVNTNIENRNKARSAEPQQLLTIFLNWTSRMKSTEEAVIAESKDSEQ